MNKAIMSVLLLLAMAFTPAYAEIKGKIVHYKSGDTQMSGYIAFDTAKEGKRPGVIIVPDWWGHGKFVRDRAREMAKLGYTAMVMDIYGGGKYVGPASEAEKMMNQFTANPKTMEERFDATYQTLIRHKTVDRKRVSAIGYSLGGMVVLEMARLGKDLAGVASIWGVIGKPAIPAGKGKVKAKILVLQPATDGWATEENVNNLKKEMTDAGTTISVIVYPGTVHAFSRPDANERAKRDKLGIRFDAKAATKSKEDLKTFLQTSFM